MENVDGASGGSVWLRFDGVDSRRGDTPFRKLAKDVSGQRLGAVGFEFDPADGEDPKSADGAIQWVTVGLAAGYLLRDLLRLAMDWSRREKRPVVVRIDDDELRLGDATDDQQHKLVEEFIARHGAEAPQGDD